MTRITFAIGGFASGVGKTTLMCELLRAFPGWEAIKMTRGHYRSCGKSAHACCVSHLLSDEPVIRSGRDETYKAGKDTGRYWDAGASNVHWVIVTDEQVEQGINLALERVVTPGVLVEGTSFRQFIRADFTVLVARPEVAQIKPSARRALALADALYLFDDCGDASATLEKFNLWQETSATGGLTRNIPIFTRKNLPELIATLQAIHTGAVAV